MCHKEQIHTKSGFPSKQKQQVSNKADSVGNHSILQRRTRVLGASKVERERQDPNFPPKCLHLCIWLQSKAG